MAGMLAHGPYAEFAVLLIISALAGAIAVRLRQPVLIAYIVVGILVGPAVFGIVTAHDQVALLAEIGVTVLLFVVGLKLDLHHIRHIGPVEYWLSTRGMKKFDAMKLWRAKPKRGSPNTRAICTSSSTIGMWQDWQLCVDLYSLCFHSRYGTCSGSSPITFPPGPSAEV